jgi:hypothetical protein
MREEDIDLLVVNLLAIGMVVLLVLLEYGV